MTRRSTCFSEMFTSLRYSRANSTWVFRPSVSSSESETTARGWFCGKEIHQCQQMDSRCMHE